MLQQYIVRVLAVFRWLDVPAPIFAVTVKQLLLQVVASPIRVTEQDDFFRSNRMRLEHLKSLVVFLVRDLRRSAVRKRCDVFYSCLINRKRVHLAFHHDDGSGLLYPCVVV